MSETRLVCPNSDQVAAKIMDGEAVLINLTTGMYYSMAGTATDVWSCIEQSCSVTAIASHLAAKYGVARDQAHEDVARLVEELQSEGLVVMSSGAQPEAAISSGSADTNLNYAAPKLEKFSDMAEMFALDPPLPGIVDTKP